jgi:hypothetical protein
MRLGKLRSDVEEPFIPQHFDPSTEPRHWLEMTLNIDKVIGPWRVHPCRFIHLPVNSDPVAAKAQITLRRNIVIGKP